MPIPILHLKRIVASQTSSRVYQIDDATFLEAYPCFRNSFELAPSLNVSENGSNIFFRHKNGVAMALWKAESGMNFPRKLAIKVPLIVSISEQKITSNEEAVLVAEQTIALDSLKDEFITLQNLRRCFCDTSETVQLIDHIPTPIGLIVFRCDKNGPLMCGLVESYHKAAPLHSLSYAFPRGITTQSNSLGTQENSLNFCRDVLFQVAHIMHALSCNGVLYRDLKLPNVLVEETGRVILVDFGHAVVADNLQLKSLPSLHATIHTSAPELFGSDNTNVFYADLWSYGILAYEWIFGRRIDVSALAHNNRTFCENKAHWWELNSSFTNGLLSEEMFTSDFEKFKEGGRLWPSATCQHQRLRSQVLMAKDLICRLLCIDVYERSKQLSLGEIRASEKSSPRDVSRLWQCVLNHPFFEEAEMWSESKGYISSCTEDVSEEIDMQTLGM